MTLANRWTNELNCKIRRKSKSNNFLLRGYFGDCESNRRSHLCDSMFFSDWPMRVSFIVTGYVVSSTTLTTRDARLIQQVLWAVLLQGCRQCDMIVEDTELKQNWPWEQSPIIDTALTGLGGGGRFGGHHVGQSYITFYVVGNWKFYATLVHSTPMVNWAGPFPM